MVGIFFLDQINVIEISSCRTAAVCMLDRAFGCLVRVLTRKSDAVRVIADTEKLDAARDRRLNDRLGAVASAERILRM